MKKLFFLTITALLLLTFVGCEETASEDIDPPSTLVLSATTNGLGVNLAWTGSTTEDIEGYNVYFEGELIAEEITTTSYQHTAPGGLGEYEVVAVLDGVESDPAEGSTELVEGTSTNIYSLNDPLDDHPSCFGWDLETGLGTNYSTAADNRPNIHIVVDGDFDIASPRTVWSEADGGNITHFDYRDASYEEVTEAAWPVPGTEYATYIDAVVGETAVLAIPDGSEFIFLKVDVTSVNATDESLTLKWGMQLIPNLLLLD